MKTSPLIASACVAGILLAAIGLYLGALAPVLKAQSFIAAERNLRSVQTVDDYKENYDRAFAVYSPVGTEEITKFLAGNILGILSQSQIEPVARQLVDYIEPHLFKDEVRHLILAGQMYQTLWQDYHHEEDYQKAIAYFEKAHEIGPRLPPPLYSLFALYGAHGDTANFRRIGREILANWPDDKKVSDALK